jgi:hypothetical protein
MSGWCRPIEEGDYAKLREMPIDFDLHVNSNFYDASTRSALGLAIFYHNPKAVTILLERGADPWAICIISTKLRLNAVEYYTHQLHICNRFRTNIHNLQKIRRILKHYALVPLRRDAIVFCMFNMGGSWPDIAQPLIERLVNTPPP